MKKVILSILILFQISWTWTFSLYIRLGAVHPVYYIPQMQKDIAHLGYWAFILDLIIFLALFFIIQPTYRRYMANTVDASGHEPLDNKTDN